MHNAARERNIVRRHVILKSESIRPTDLFRILLLMTYIISIVLFCAERQLRPSRR